MEQRAPIASHKSFNSFYNSYASKKREKQNDEKRDTSTGNTTATDQAKKRGLTIKSFKSDQDEKLGGLKQNKKKDSFAY